MLGCPLLLLVAGYWTFYQTRLHVVRVGNRMLPERTLRTETPKAAVCVQNRSHCIHMTHQYINHCIRTSSKTIVSYLNSQLTQPSSGLSATTMRLHTENWWRTLPSLGKRTNWARTQEKPNIRKWLPLCSSWQVVSGTEVEQVEGFKFVGLYIFWYLMWSTNTTAKEKKAQQGSVQLGGW